MIPDANNESGALALPLHPSAATQGQRVKRSRIDRFNIDVPWSPHLYYYSVRGAENFHIYLWVLKDWGWTQDWSTFTLVFGYAALGWCLVLLFHAVKQKNTEDTYMLIPLIIWLFGNFWWMYGEEVNNDDDVHGPQAGDMFLAAMSMIVVYHLFLRPLKIIEADVNTTIKYSAAGLVPRFSYFENWRQYEHIHTFFWLGKDYCWNTSFFELWVVFTIPTVLIALDFVYVTWTKQWMFIDCCHYFAQLMWVIGNMLWALSEVYFENEDDQVESMWVSDRHNRALLRWWSSWILFSALFSIFVLYFIWLPLTAMGYLRTVGDIDGFPVVENDDVIDTKGFAINNTGGVTNGTVYIAVKSNDVDDHDYEASNPIATTATINRNSPVQCIASPDEMATGRVIDSSETDT